MESNMPEASESSGSGYVPFDDVETPFSVRLVATLLPAEARREFMLLTSEERQRCARAYLRLHAAVNPPTNIVFDSPYHPAPVLRDVDFKWDDVKYDLGVAGERIRIRAGQVVHYNARCVLLEVKGG